MAEEKTLPGWPKKRLVKQVRSHLWSYGIRPKHTVWHATWAWASAIANSYFHTHWPLPSEIANQYVFLLLGYMQQPRAETAIPGRKSRSRSGPGTAGRDSACAARRRKAKAIPETDRTTVTDTNQASGRNPTFVTGDEPWLGQFQSPPRAGRRSGTSSTTGLVSN
jgi:hypothetical protein